MATNFSSALQMTNSASAALLRAWCQFVFDTFVTKGGWVQTADTGQVTISTLAVPGATNTIMGYHIYRMADTLQSTAPCFVRINFRSGTVAAATPVIGVTVGTGTDGAGNITGVLLPEILVQNATNATSACNSYGSADTNRCQLMMFVRSGATDSILFSIERTKNASTGADTSDGFLVTFQDTNPGTLTVWVNSTPGAQPPFERWTVILSNNNPSTFGANTGIGFPLHFKGFVQPVGLGVIVTNVADFIAAAQPGVSIYGSAHTYQLADSSNNGVSVATGAGSSTSATNRRFGIRFE